MMLTTVAYRTRCHHRGSRPIEDARLGDGVELTIQQPQRSSLADTYSVTLHIRTVA